MLRDAKSFWYLYVISRIFMFANDKCDFTGYHLNNDIKLNVFKPLKNTLDIVTNFQSDHQKAWKRSSIYVVI